MGEEFGRGELRRRASEICQAALARGPLIRDGRHWRFGGRRFSDETVKRLLDEGIAFRDGSIVRLTGK
jgi:hypothetical protein